MKLHAPQRLVGCHAMQICPNRTNSATASAAASNPPPASSFLTAPQRSKMTLEASIVAGVSVTAAVAFRSLIDRVRRGGPGQSDTGRARSSPARHNTARVTLPASLDSQDPQYVTGNMVLATM